MCPALGLVVNAGTASGHDHPKTNTTYFATCVVINIICTFGIVVRLWHAAWSNRATLHSNSDIYLQTIVIVMESGAIFTAISAICLISVAIQSIVSVSVLQVFINIGVQTAVIAPLLILVRTHFGISHGLGPVWKGSGQSDSKLRTMTTLRGTRTEGTATELQSWREDRSGAIPIDIIRETVGDSKVPYDSVGTGTFYSSEGKEGRLSDVESGRGA